MINNNDNNIQLEFYILLKENIDILSQSQKNTFLEILIRRKNYQEIIYNIETLN